jgi:glycosyltransferase involved in cell wall biosynthesis
VEPTTTAAPASKTHSRPTEELALAPRPTEDVALAPRPTEDVVLVHDYLLVMRGAERTFIEIAACFPDAPIATLLHDPIGTAGRFRHRRVRTSFLQPVAADQRRFRRYLPLLPLAARRLPLGSAGVVISSSSAFAHGVCPPPDSVHVSYCHSPFRYVWHERRRTEEGVAPLLRPLAHGVLGVARRWDVAASRRVTAYIANSALTAERIADFYGRETSVVHPPVDVDRFDGVPAPEDYFLLVGEVTSHKNPELALEAAERAGVKVKVVGDGPELPRLRQRFTRATFLGRVSDRRLIELYAGCRALIVPAIEEFGITMVEAHAAGRPVVAAGRGGAVEIVDDGDTGVLFTPGNVDALAEALRETDWERFDIAWLKARAQRFSSRQFRRRFSTELARILDHPLGAAAAANGASSDHGARLRGRPAVPTGA